MPPQSALERVDVGRLLDEGRLGPYQLSLVGFAALTIIFDGADIQLLGIAVPAMAGEWRISRSAFAPVLATGLVGMMIGGAIGGLLGDRIGRRIALIGSLFAFAVMTLAIAAVDSLAAVGACRFLAGLGFGATVPNAVALTSEYVPLRHRAFAVTLTMVCVPIGGTLAALIASQVLPAFGWRALFVIGGLAPLVVAVVLIAVLPESPRYLARHPHRWGELGHVLRRAGHDVDANAVFVEDDDRGAGRASLAALFSRDLRHDTIAIWIGFAACLIAVYLGFNWVPSMLAGAGLGATVASTGLAAFNLGGVAGAILAAWMITRVGSKPAMLATATLAVFAAIATSSMSIAATSPAGPIVLMLGVTGGLINAVQIALYALTAYVYPTTVRATGVGSAAAVGRLGAIASAFTGAWALEVGGPRLLFTLVAAAMTVVAAMVALVRKHIPVTR